LLSFIIRERARLVKDEKENKAGKERRFFYLQSGKIYCRIEGKGGEG